MQMLPGLIGLGGAALGAYGQAAPATKDSTSTTTPVEPGYQSAFRQSLLPKYNSLLAQAGKPVYGDAQRANFMGNLNTLANSATNNLANTLASRTGSLNGGAFSSGATNIALGRLGQMANYDAMVPAANQAAQLQNTSQVLGMGLNFVGRAPIGSTTTAHQTETNGNFLSNLAGNLGNMAAGSKPGSKTGVNPFNYIPMPGGGYTGTLPGEVPSNDDSRTSIDFPGVVPDHSGTTGLTRDPSGLYLRGGSEDSPYDGAPTPDYGPYGIPGSYDYGMNDIPTLPGYGNTGSTGFAPYYSGGSDYQSLPVGPSGLDPSQLYPQVGYDPYGAYSSFNQGNPSDPDSWYYNPYESYKG